MLVLITYCLAISVIYLLFKTQKEMKPIDKLKNALLSHALMLSGDVDDNNFNYKGFDGTKLPSFSGNSMTNACWNYKLDKELFRKSMFYTSQMESKINAIEKYINLNLDTNEKVYEFFEKYCNSQSKT